MSKRNIFNLIMIILLSAIVTGSLLSGETMRTLVNLGLILGFVFSFLAEIYKSTYWLANSSTAFFILALCLFILNLFN